MTEEMEMGALVGPASPEEIQAAHAAVIARFREVWASTDDVLPPGPVTNTRALMERAIWGDTRAERCDDLVLDFVERSASLTNLALEIETERTMGLLRRTAESTMEIILGQRAKWAEE